MLLNVSCIAGRFFTTEPPVKPSMHRTAPHNKEFSISKHLEKLHSRSRIVSCFHVLKTCVYVLYEHLASFKHPCLRKLDYPDGSMVKNPPANEGDTGDAGSIPWRRKWQPTPIFLPRKSMDKEGACRHI